MTHFVDANALAGAFISEDQACGSDVGR